MVRARDITTILELKRRDPATEQELFDLIRQRFQLIASSLLARERVGHSLQPTMLVDDAFLQLVRSQQNRWDNREQFFAHAARVMRSLLVDHARAQLTAKRGGGEHPVPLEQIGDAAGRQNLQSLVELNDIVEQLETQHPDVFQVFNLHYFMCYELQEIAEDILQVSYSTVRRRWKTARAFLHRALTEDDS